MTALEEKTKESSTKQTVPIFRIPVWLIERNLQCQDGSFLQGKRESTFIVEAESGVQAVEQLTKSLGYSDNYNALPREKREKIRQTFRLRKGEPERLPNCERRHKNRDGDYTCGVPVHAIEDHPDKDDDFINSNGEFGMCCLEGYDAPEDCPVARYHREKLDKS